MPEMWCWVITAACWGLLILVWIAGAVHAARRSPRKRVRSSAGLGKLFLVTFPLTWAVGVVVPVDRWPSLPTGHEWVATAAVGGLVACLAFAVWARVTLGTMWTATPGARGDHVLRTGGPYAVTRHPIYTGVLGMILCTAVISRHSAALALFAMAAVTLAVKIRAEERVLGEVFGREYDAYRARVPGIVPLRVPARLRPVR